MRVLIIEDEQPAVNRLTKLIRSFDPAIEVVDCIDSVEDTVKWLKTFKEPDLMFLDIQLADGLSFDIFTQVQIMTPVIFTTAYDQYMMQAFKVNSFDYLLKPIDPEEFVAAMNKFRQLNGRKLDYDPSFFQGILDNIQKKSYRERFLIKSGQKFDYLPVTSIAYFYSEDGLQFATDKEGKKHIIDGTLESIENDLDHARYFRISRKMILSIDSIKDIQQYFSGRLKLAIEPNYTGDVIVSRDRVQNFKDWLDR